jgi:hypothetical protein
MGKAHRYNAKINCIGNLLSIVSTMDLSKINEWSYWQKSLPIASQLREGYPKEWYRKHTLANSRRLPNNIEELQTVLNANRQTLSALEMTSNISKVIIGLWNDTQENPEIPKILKRYDNNFTILHRVLGSNANKADEGTMIFYVSDSFEDKENIYKLIEDVSQDKIADVTFVADGGKWLMHPYDGGIDIFLKDIVLNSNLEALGFLKAL